MVELAGGVGLVGRLVGGKPDVAVDPEHRPPRVARDLGREARQPDVHLLDQAPQRIAHLGLVDGAVALEPLPASCAAPGAGGSASAAGRKPRYSDVAGTGAGRGIGRVTRRSFSARVMLLDRQLSAQRGAAVGRRLHVDQPDRPARPGVRGAAAGVVGRLPPGRVGGNPRVQGAVAAAGDVNVPCHMDCNDRPAFLSSAQPPVHTPSPVGDDA